MEDIEAVVRHIVALSDVSITTKKMVRKQYMKFTGISAIPAFEKKIINSTLDKIVLELAQKMQAEDALNSKTRNNEMFEDKKATMLVSKAHSAASQQKRQIMESQNEIFMQKVFTVEQNSEENQQRYYPTSEIINSHSFCKSAGQPSLALRHSDSNNTMKSSRVCVMNRQVKSYRLSSSEVLAAILNGDISDSEFCDSPQENRNLGGKLSKLTDLKQKSCISGRNKIKILHELEVGDIESNDSEENTILKKKYRWQEDAAEQTGALNNNEYSVENTIVSKKHRLQEKQVEQSLRPLNNNEYSEKDTIAKKKCRWQTNAAEQSVALSDNEYSEEDIIASKIHRLQEKPVERLRAPNNNQCTFYKANNHGHRSNSPRNVTNFVKNLRCKNDITSSPQDRRSTCVSAQILEMNIPKYIKECIIDISSDSSCDCLISNANFYDSPKSHNHHEHKDRPIVNCRQQTKNFNEIEWISDSENSQDSFCLNFADNPFPEADNWQRNSEDIWHRAVTDVDKHESDTFILSNSEYSDSSDAENCNCPVFETAKDIFKEKSHIHDRESDEDNWDLAPVAVAESILEENAHINSGECDENCDMTPVTTAAFSHKENSHINDRECDENCDTTSATTAASNHKENSHINDRECDENCDMTPVTTAASSHKENSHINDRECDENCDMTPVTTAASSYKENSHINSRECDENCDLTPVSISESSLEENSYIHGGESDQEIYDLAHVPESISHEDLSSDDSFTSFCKIRKRNRLKKVKRFLDSSDSELDNTSCCHSMFSNKTKLCGKGATVEIKVVDRNCKDVCEIKNIALTDLDIIENIEKFVSRKWKDTNEKRKQVSENFYWCKKRKAKQENSLIVSHSGKKMKYGNNKSSGSVKHANIKRDDSEEKTIRKKKHRLHKNDADCYEEGACTLRDTSGCSDSDSDYDIPLRSRRSQKDFLPEDAIRKHNSEVGIHKCPAVMLHDTAGGIKTRNILNLSTCSTCRVCDNTVNEVDSSTNKISSYTKNEVDDSLSKVTNISRNEVDNSPSKVTHISRNEVDNSSSKVTHISRNKVDNSPSKVTHISRNEVDNSPSKVTHISRNEHHDSNSLGVSTLKKDPFDFNSSSSEMSSPNVFLVRSRKTTLYSKGNNSFPTSSSVYNICSSDDDDEYFSTPVIHELHQKSRSEITSFSVSDTSSVFITEKCDKENKLAFPSLTKLSESSELTKLREICSALGLMLRNTKELSGCFSDEDKVQRIKQLLKEKGMEGTPSLQKVEKFILVKEVKELQCKNITSSQEKGCSKRKVNEGLFGNIQNSPERRRNVIDNCIQSKFSDLRDVFTTDSSD